VAVESRPSNLSLQIELLGANDAAVLQRVAPGVFDGPIDPRWTAEFLADARHHLVVARDVSEVVGMATAVHYVHPDKAPELWINEVGVAPTHRGRGVGRQLLDALLAHGRALGCHTAWVLTDQANPPAERLYESAGGVEAPPGGKMFTFELGAGDKR
jgi:GNAT superfamily N-acetyltransferase